MKERKCDVIHKCEENMRSYVNNTQRDERLKMNSVTLRSWQERVLTFVNTPSDRKIIFIIGKNVS